MAVDIDTYLLELKARTDRYDRDLRGARNRTDRELSAIDRRFAMTNRNLRSGALGMGTLLGGIGAYIGVQQIKDYADSWNSVTRSLEASESIFGMRLRSASDLNKLANEARIDNDALAKLYIRTAAATRELGASEEEVAKVTTTVAKALKLGSASASEQTSVMLQLSQALQKGKLDGDEFRSVMENAGVIQELLADKMKVSKGEIVKMAAEGKLSVELLFSSLLDGGEKVDRIFRQMPATIGESMLVLNNNIEEYIGNLDKAYGTTEAMVEAVKTLSANVEPLADGALVAGAALLAAFSPSIIAGITAMTVGVAASAGSIGLILGGLAGAASYVELFGDEISIVDAGLSRVAKGTDDLTRSLGFAGYEARRASEEMITLKDAFPVIIRVMLEDANRLVSQAMDYLAGSVGVTAEEVGQTIKKVLNTLIGGVVYAKDVIAAAFTEVPKAVSEKLIDAVNALLQGLQSMLDGVTDGINNLIAGINRIPGLDLGFLVAPDLGQIENTYAGAGKAAGAAFADAAGAFSRDWVGEAGSALKEVGKSAGEAVEQYMDGILDRMIKNTEPALAHYGEMISARELAMFNAQRRRFSEKMEIDRAIDQKASYPSSDVDKAGEKARRSFERDMLQLEGRIALQKQEADLIGRSAFEVERMRTKQELLNEARKAGVELTAADLVKIDALSAGMASAVTEAQTLRTAYEDLQAESKEFMSSFITDLKNGTSASEALSSALDRIADKLIDMAVDNLAEAALGGLNGRGGNAIGSQGGSALLSMIGFSRGGYTGAGSKNQPAGIVHKGEVVWSQDDVARAGGVAAVEGMRMGMRGYADGGTVALPNVSVPAVAVSAAHSGSPQINMPVTFHIENGTPEGIDKLKTEIVPLIKRVAEGALDQRFERKERYRRVTKS